MIELNGARVTPTMFPDKTSQVWRVEPVYPDTNRITWEFEHEGELMHIAQLATLLRGTRVRLYMPFLPYGRQDKDVSNETTFAVHAFAHMINALKFDTVTTLDAHSNVFLDLTGAVNNIPLGEIGLATHLSGPDILGFPDAGANRRYSSLTHFSAVVGQKYRDSITGAVTLEALAGVDPKGKRVLIVDDICDGGATFIHFASLLYRQGARSVHLYTTHGIYSKGLDVLKNAGIERIFNRKGEIT